MWKPATWTPTGKREMTVWLEGIRTDLKFTFFATGKQGKYVDLVKGKVDVDFVVRLERKNDSHTISNKTFDFSKTTIDQLIEDGHNETKEQMKEVLIKSRV